MQTHNFHTHTENKVLKKLKKKARGQPNCTSLNEIIVQSLHPYKTSRQQGILKMACVYCMTTLIPLPVMVGPYRIITKHICDFLVLFTLQYSSI